MHVLARPSARQAKVATTFLRRRASASPPPTSAAGPLTYAAGGSLAGFAGSLIGLGGGFVVVPVLTRVAGFTQHQAHGTSLCVVAATGVAGAVTFGSADAVDLRAAAIMAAAGVVCSPLGARFSGRFDSNSLGILMGAFMMTVAPLVPLKGYYFRSQDHSSSSSSSSTAAATATTSVAAAAPGHDLKDVADAAQLGPAAVAANDEGRAAAAKVPADATAAQSANSGTSTGSGCSDADATAASTTAADRGAVNVTSNRDDASLSLDMTYCAIGAGTGFISGLFGVGGGSIMVPACAIIGGMSQHVAVGTSLCAMVLPSIVGTVQHRALGNVVLSAAPPLVAGAATGTWLGSKLGLSLPQDQLEGIFFLLMFVLGFRQLKASRAKQIAARLAPK